MRASKLMMTILVLAVAVGASGQSLQRSNARIAPPATIQAAQDGPVTTTRDARGVWFIEGGTLYDVYEAMGYAVATDRLWQMDIFRRVSRGKLAEILGPAAVAFDVPMRTIGYSDDELAAQFAALSDDAQTMVQAYVDGINRRIAEFPSDWLQMPFEYWLFSIQSVLLQGIGLPVLPTPWEVNDVLAWVVTLTRNFDPEGDVIFGDNAQLDNIVLIQTLGAVYGAEGQAMFGDLRWVNDPTAQTVIPPNGAKAVAAPDLKFPAFDPDELAELREAINEMKARNAELGRFIEDVGARVKMGSYAWAVSGDKTASGNPILYSGPQMGFAAPTYVVEGSIRGGGLEISGMTVPGIPGIIIGRTPHHAWSMQVGHAHTVDFWLEAPETVNFHRMETINVFGGAPVTIPVFRSAHGPIVEPMPYNPADPPSTIVSFAYGQWGREVGTIDAYLGLARAQNMDEFDAAIAQVAVSQHYTYVDRDGNIAYWMSGWDPVRGPGYNPLIPSFTGLSPEWTGERRPRIHDRNTAQGYYGGWNNKGSVDYINATNTYGYYFGPFHRAHVVDEYLSAHDDLTFEELRDLALNVATTESFAPTSTTSGGGIPWSFVADAFTAVIAANPNDDRDAAIAMLEAWDGHFVAGGPSEWRFGAFKADAWVLQDGWIREVLRITFEDEFAMAGMSWEDQPISVLYNVLLRALAGQTFYDWFQDKRGTGDKPTGAEAIIVRALDNVIEHAGLGPYNELRGTITYSHSIFGQIPVLGPIYAGTPFSNRSTYAHGVEYDMNGPLRIESMFPLGESGAMYYQGSLTPAFDPNFFSMVPVFDPFMARPFPLFE
jgi:penicillin amidase